MDDNRLNPLELNHINPETGNLINQEQYIQEPKLIGVLGIYISFLFYILYTLTIVGLFISIPGFILGYRALKGERDATIWSGTLAIFFCLVITGIFIFLGMR